MGETAQESDSDNEAVILATLVGLVRIGLIALAGAISAAWAKTKN